MGSTTGVWGLQFGSFGLLRHLFRFVPCPHGDSEEIRHLVSQEFHIPETVLPVHVPTRHCYLHPSPGLNLLCTGSSKIEKTDSRADPYFVIRYVSTLANTTLRLRWSAGSVSFLASWAVLMGPIQYAQHLTSGSRLPFTAAYFGSIALTMYFAVGVSSISLFHDKMAPLLATLWIDPSD
jgi:hypothetical protein